MATCGSESYSANESELLAPWVTVLVSIIYKSQTVCHASFPLRITLSKAFSIHKDLMEEKTIYYLFCDVRSERSVGHGENQSDFIQTETVQLTIRVPDVCVRGVISLWNAGNKNNLSVVR
jgi:hypothetical protein